MRVLLLSNKFPYPPRDGGAIATLNVARAMAKLGHGVTVLAMNTTKHYFNPMELPEELTEEIMFHSVRVQNEVTSIGAMKALFRNRSYNVQRFVSKEFEEQLRMILRDHGPFDVVQLEGIYLTYYIPVIRQHSKALVILRAHNLEHQIWERRARNESSLFRKQYLNILSRQLKSYETKMLKEVDALVPISPIDELGFRKLGYSGPSHMCPASFDEARLSPSLEAPAQHSIFFLGALDWAPNVEGLKWFVSEVWRKVLAHHPDLMLQIAGRNMPEEIKFLHAPNVNVLGEVEDAVQFMNLFNLMIVPLFSGSGMRVKIVEGMALGKVIITTPVGAEGINGKNGIHYLLASTPEEFAQQILRCLKGGELCQLIRSQAIQFARAHFGSMSTTSALLDFYKLQMKA